MKHPVRSVTNRWRQYRWRRAIKKQGAKRREFVYLDDVSVFSLVASREKGITTEFTETQSDSLKQGGNSSMQLAVGPFSVGAGSASERTSQTSTQVLRKSVIQNTFAQLYEIEKNALCLKPLDGAASPPRVDNIVELEKAAGTFSFKDWVVDSDALQRGFPLEIEVRLSTDVLFKFATMVDAMSDMAESLSTVLNAGGAVGIEEAKVITSLVEQLGVGLVPVSGNAVDYKVITLDGKTWLVHRRIIEQLSPAEQQSAEPLVVVGVTELSLFWKDVRKVLFSNGVYRLFGRVTEAGLRTEWNPLKLVDLLAEMSPNIVQDLSRARAAMTQSLYAAAHMTNGVSPESADPQIVATANALFSYAKAVRPLDSSLTDEDLRRYCARMTYEKDEWFVVEKRRALFDQLNEWTGQADEKRLTATELTEARQHAIREAGMTPDGVAAPVTEIVDTSSDAQIEAEPVQHLEVEVVAIYW